MNTTKCTTWLLATRRPSAGWSHRSAGTAMIEAVLVLPILMVIFALIFYFGFALVRAQQTQGYARYEAWRDAADAPGPSLLPGVGASVDSAYAPQPTLYADELSFPQGRQGSAAPDGTTREVTTYFPPEPGFELIAFVNAINPDAAELAEVLSGPDGLPAGKSVRVFVTDTPDTAFARQFAGPIQHRFFRPDGDWRYVNNIIAPDYTRWYDTVTGEWIELDGVVPPRRLVSISDAVRQTDLRELDQVLSLYLRRDNNPLLGTIDRFLSLPAAYLGPHIETTFGEEPTQDATP